jgi:hypothetical protein
LTTDTTTTATERPQTASELRDALFVDLADRRKALEDGIERDGREVIRLKAAAAESSSWQDHGAARLAMSQADALHAAIDRARLALRTLDDERERVMSGRDERLAEAIRAEARSGLAASQLEHRQALEAFYALITPELKAAAARHIEAAKGMGFDFIPSPIAVAIVQLN